MKGVSIIGNAELPKSLYIVPWQQAEQSALSGQSLNELWTPLDRAAFLQELDRETPTKDYQLALNL